MWLGFLAILGFVALAFALAHGMMDGVAFVVILIILLVAYLLSLVDVGRHPYDGGDGR